jgi:signal transduction histidine kinase
MFQREILRKISPLPLVDLVSIDQPFNGTHVKVNSTCKHCLEVETKCKDHYRALALKGADNSVVPCPFGFSSFVFKSDNARLAFSCIIPFPRTGAAGEGRWAKRHPEIKCSVEVLRSYSEFINRTIKQLADAEKETAKKYTMAFHEIRKLNRNIKLQAERLYQATVLPGEAELRKKHETIFRAAEMLSAQFEIIEVLADESLASLPLKAKSELYRIFDKCVRIYQTNPPRIGLDCNQNYHPVAMTCDKTFPIIPTVLIENALRYSLPGTQIAIKFDPEGDFCNIRITNEAKLEKPLDNSIFVRGVRATAQTEGSGFGLYLAQIVARQHYTLIEVSSTKIAENRFRCTFNMRFRLVAPE